MFYGFIIAALVLATVTQHFLGAVPPWGARVFLMPLVFLYGALSFSTGGMLFLAFLSGLMWDLLHAQWVEETVELGVGWSVIVYAILGIIMSGLRPLFLRGRWEVHCLFSGIATSVLVLAEYLMISLRFEFNPEIWGRILGAGVVALVLSPFVFMALGYLSRLMKHQHYRPEREGFSP